MLEPDIVEEREGRFLIVWGDAPHWIVADGDVLELVRSCDGRRSIADIVGSLALRGGRSPDETLPEARSVMAQLERAGVAYHKAPRRRPLSRRPVLENVTINVTRRCNLRCAHCFLGAPAGRETLFRTADLERFLRGGKGYLAKGINFSLLGGEPLLEKQRTLELARLTARWGGETVVSTNGLLVDGDFAAAAKDCGLTVQVSLEGSSPAVNDRVRGRGGFERAVRGVEALVEAGAHTIVSMVVQRDNLDDVGAMYALSERLGTDEVRFIPLTLMGRARGGAVEPVGNVELLHALRRVLREHPAAKERMRRDYFTILKTMCSLSNRRAYCGTGLKTILVDADGQTYPCPNHQFPEFRCGSISERSFREIWLESPVLRRVRETYDVESVNPECAACPVRHWCMGGCRGETFECTGDMRARSVRCEELRAAVLEMMWIMGSEGAVTADAERVEYF